MNTPIKRFCRLLSFSAVLVGCSAGQSTGSQVNHGPGSGPGSSGASPNIDTSSGNPSGSGDPSGSNGDCGTTLAVTYRDFSGTHPDFEMPFSGDVVRRHLVKPDLGPDHKPVFNDRVGQPALADTPLAVANWMVTMPVIQSAESFNQWYNTTPGVNLEFKKELTLVGSPPGSGIFGYASSAFFPLAPTEGFGITPPNNNLHMNFLFTTEVHVSFTYTAAQKFTFSGDDDLWIFVNGKLALDLGSMHAAAAGTIDFDAQAADLGIVLGQSYPMDVFHAERHTSGSNFKITTNIACFVPVGVVK